MPDTSCDVTQLLAKLKITPDRRTKHGCSHGVQRTTEYTIWCGMRQRCLNPTAKDFARYGGRGIKICERWDNFLVFLKDMGFRPNGKMLERKDNNGDYGPDNCIWATPHEQALNRRRHFRTFFIIQGIRASFVQHCERIGIRPQCVMHRLTRGWDEEEAFTYPVRKVNRSGMVQHG